MRGIVIALVLIVACAGQLAAEEISVDLRFEPGTAALSDRQLAAVKEFRGVRIHPFVDQRVRSGAYLGELKLNGQTQKVSASKPLSLYATDAFKKVYTEWGGKISPDGPLALKGEITQFAFEESDGYQAKISFHFFLLDDSSRILWDGHSSGIVRGTGKTIGADNLSPLISDILRVTYNELLDDDKLVAVWTGRVSNTYVIRGDAAKVSANSGR